MTTSDDTFTKRSADGSDYNYYNTSTLACNNVTMEYDRREKWNENLSSATIKKLYSYDKLSLDFTNTKSDLPVVKNGEKFDKINKLFPTSSTILEKENLVDHEEPVKKPLVPEQRYEKLECDLHTLNAINKKKHILETYIQENPKSADMKWSLFCAACHSYRYDFVLKPFPPMFFKEDTKDIDRLRNVAETCPSISVLQNQIQDKSCDALSPDLINLLHWVLIELKEPLLKIIPKEKHNSILSEVESTTTTTMPNYIFQVIYTRRSNEEKFNEYSNNYSVIHAYHGTRLDNFYSILNYGLRISFTKHSSNGPGIYLSSEMNVSLPYSHSGFTWGGSYFGSQISILALCEMIDHPDVKYTDEKKKNNFGSDLDSIPEKYFVVTNADLIRVKYLLIFSNSMPLPRENQILTTSSWLQRNKVIAMMIAYIILLLAVATSNSVTTRKIYRQLLRSFGYKV